MNKKIGFRVGERFFENKLSALQHAGGDIDKLELYFMDEVWDQLDWTQEPKQSWHELLDQAANRIRSNYQHVALFFSAGYDSLTILNTFNRNNLLLDEVILFAREWDDLQIEESKVAYQYSLMLKNTVWPNLKITHYYRTPEHTIQYYSNFKDNWSDGSRGDLLQFTKEPDMFGNFTGQIINDIHKHTHIYIYGMDKPRVDFYQGKWYSMQVDTLTRYMSNRSGHAFYWSVEDPLIYLKQTWMMINWLEENFDVTHEMVHQLQSINSGPLIYEQWNRFGLGRDPVPTAHARYGTGVKKSRSGGYIDVESSRLRQIVEKTNPNIVKTWANGINELRESFSSAWDESKGLKTVISKKRYVKDYEPKFRLKQQMLGK